MLLPSVSSLVETRGKALLGHQERTSDREGFMSQIDAGVSPDLELEIELPDDGRETPEASSSGSNSPDTNNATPGTIVRGGDDGAQGA
jgi:hypothetical protein